MNYLQLFLLLLLIPFNANGQDPVLISDYNPGTQSSISDFDFNGVVLDDKLLIQISNEEHGEELGIYTDGVLSLLKDINPGNDGSFPTEFIVYQDRIYFSAFDQENGFALWVSDGTAEGTDIFFDVDGTSAAEVSAMLVSNSNTMYFNYNSTIYSTNGISVNELQGNVNVGYNGGQLRNLSTFQNEVAFLDNQYRLFVVENGAAVEKLTVPGEFLSQQFAMAEVSTGLVIKISDSFDEDIDGSYLFSATDETLQKFTIDGSKPLLIHSANNERVIIYIVGQGYYLFNGIIGTESKVANSMTTFSTQGQGIISQSYNGKTAFLARTGSFDMTLNITDGTSAGSIEFTEVNNHNTNMILSDQTAYVTTGTSNGFNPTIYTIDMEDSSYESLFEFDQSSLNTRSVQMVAVVNNELVFTSNLNSDLGRELYSLQIGTNIENKEGKFQHSIKMLENGFLVESSSEVVGKASIYSTNGALVESRMFMSNKLQNVSLRGNFVLVIEFDGQLESKMVYWKWM